MCHGMRDFESLLDQYFGFLSRDYGFTRIPDDADSACFKKGDVEVSIGRNRGALNVEFSKGGPPTIRQTDSYFNFDLWCFAVDRDGEEHTYRYRNFDSDAELTAHLEDEMATAAKALRKYGIEVLEGRFNDWKGLRTRLAERV